MEIDVTPMTCQHPFGDGIHVLVPPPDSDVAIAVLGSLGIAKQLYRDCKNLRKLVTDQEITASYLYTGKMPNDNPGTCYAVLGIRMFPDPELGANYMAVILLIDPDWEEEGRKVAELLCISVRKFAKDIQ